MLRSKLLTATAAATSLAAGSLLATGAASAQVAYVPPGPVGFGYYDYYYAPGPVALGADIIGGALDLGLTAATLPFWAPESWDYPDYYATYAPYPAYGYGSVYEPYGYPGPAYAYYDKYTGSEAALRSRPHHLRVVNRFHHRLHHYAMIHRQPRGHVILRSHVMMKNDTSHKMIVAPHTH